MQLRTATLAVAAVILCCSIASSNAQENIQLQIPPSLVECYNTSYYMNRDNRLPSTIDTLITLIEKVENSEGFNMDMRQLAVALLHRFRQDGITRAPGIIASPGVLPYSPTGFQFPKFRILLSRLIPGDALRFPNNSLSSEERCSMHFMLSSSFNLQVRGDENQVCNQLSQYRAQRLPRAVNPQERNNFIGDIEILENLSTKSQNRGLPQAGKQIRRNPNADFDYWSDGDGFGSNDNSISQCPVENGVIWTPWGAVTAGTLMAGIAAGLQPQQVQLRTLLALARRQGVSAPQTATVNVDNRWAATLAGDLAEVALVQVPTSASESASVGANGAWNSTVMPKWYFLTQRQNLEMTDAEIRGGLDGLILGMNIANWRTQAYSMKLSQLLRMYYSMDGVLGSGIMACNRKDQFPLIAPLNDLIAQTSAFAQVLDREMQLRVTLSPTAIAQFSTSAANAVTAYIPQYMNDVSCSVSNALPQDVSQSITAMTDIYVYLDTSWQYSDIVNYVNYVLQRLNINPYASSVTLISASNCAVIVNTTNTLSDIYENWNVTTHATFQTGFNLPNILRSVQNLTQFYMNGQKANSSVGGRSLVALLMPNMAMVSDADNSFSVTRLQYINEQVPDLRFIYFGGGTITRFTAFVQSARDDLFPLSIGSNVVSAAGPVVMRIKKMEQILHEPSCPIQDEQTADIYEAITPMTHIYIFMDTLWPYRDVVDYLNYILQRLNINPFASSVTMLSASDTSTMVNTTYYMSDFYRQWNVTTHGWFKYGFSLPRILSKVRDLVEERTAADIISFSMAGYSLVALIMPSPSASITDQDFDYSMRFIGGLNRTLPDLNFIYYAGGAVVRFKDLVQNPHEDLFRLSTDIKVKDASAPVLRRIKRIPRRIINPRCSLAWNTFSYGHNRLVQYARPGGINFYRLAPNYFFETTNDRTISVQAINTVTFTVCTSRVTVVPYRNGSASVPNQSCGQITTNIFSLDLSQVCEAYDAPIECPPVYLSVQAQSFVSAEQVSCTDEECQAPDQAMYAVQMKNMDCYGGGAAILAISTIFWSLSTLLSLSLGLETIF